MGQYLIPGADARHFSQVVFHLEEQSARNDDQIWDPGTEGGTLFTDPTRTDAQCEALYSGLALSDDIDWQRPIPLAVRSHLQHLRDYLQASPGAITNAQTVHAVQDLIRAVHFLNSRFANEG